MLYISELCEDCAVANEINYEIDDAWTNIHGIHDNGPRDHGVWRLTLAAYCSESTEFYSNTFHMFLNQTFSNEVYSHLKKTESPSVR